MGGQAIGKARKILVRLKHPLPADEEIDTVMPDRLEEFAAALEASEAEPADDESAEVK